MARKVSEKSQIVRRGIEQNPDMADKPTQLAELLNTQNPGYDFKPVDISNQKIALAKAVQKTGFLPAEEPVTPETGPQEGPGIAAEGQPGAGGAATPPTPQARPATPAQPTFGPQEVKQLALLSRKAGGVKVLAQWLDMIEAMERK